MTFDERLRQMGMERAEIVAAAALHRRMPNRVTVRQSQDWREEAALAWDEYVDAQVGESAAKAARDALTRQWRIRLSRMRYLWREADARGCDLSAPMFVRNVVASLGCFTQPGKTYPEWRVLPRDHDIPRQNVTYVVGIRELSSTERN